MSSLPCCEYRELAGKTIRRICWSKDLDSHNLSIDFTDETQVSFRFSLTIDEYAELSDFEGGSLTNPRALTPAPVRAQVKPLEDE